MKYKKTMAGLISLGAFAGVLPCVAFKANTNVVDNTNTISLKQETTFKAASPFDGIECAVVPAVLQNIATSGTQILSASVGTAAKYLVTNILKDYGIDMRDPSIIYLERIEGEIKEIKAQIAVLSANQDKYNAERSLDNLYSYVNYASADIMNHVKGGLWDLFKLEQTNKDDDYVEAQRKDFYETSLKDFKVNGSNVADFVTRFANTIVTPVSSAPTNDLFHYYQLTNGQFDKWSTQSYNNRRSYIAYLDSLLLSSANLAIFDYHYRNEGAGSATKASNDTRYNNMIAAVNEANGKFQKELLRLEEYETLRQKGEVIYLPTNTHYSTKMATLTFNHEDKERQLLLKGVERKVMGDKVLQSTLLTYQANHKMVNDVVTDYKNYVEAYGLKDLTINDYLKSIGFTADRQDLFDKANGLYYGELRINHSGYQSDDLSVSIHHYDKYGNAKNKTQFFVECHHKFLIADEYVTRYSDDEYYLCLQKANLTLDGEYWANVFTGSKRNGTATNLVNAFSNSLQNRVDSEDSVVKNAKFQ